MHDMFAVCTSENQRGLNFFPLRPKINQTAGVESIPISFARYIAKFELVCQLLRYICYVCTFELCDCFRLYGPPKANGDKTLIIYEASPARPSPQAKKTVPVNTHCHIGFVHFNITMCNQGNKLSWASQLLMIGQHWKLLIMLYGLKNCNFNFGIESKKNKQFCFCLKIITEPSY